MFIRNTLVALTLIAFFVPAAVAAELEDNHTMNSMVEKALQLKDSVRPMQLQRANAVGYDWDRFHGPGTPAEQRASVKECASVAYWPSTSQVVSFNQELEAAEPSLSADRQPGH